MSEITTIPQSLIETIATRLSQNKRVRYHLPGEGRLHIDRSVPFLCVYRRPCHRPDEGTEQLVVGEASYLIAFADRHLHRSLTTLVARIVRTLADEFGAFLLVELWSTPHSPPENGRGQQQDAPQLATRPAFRIISQVPPNDPITPTMTRMEQSLQRVRCPPLSEETAYVEVVYDRPPTPPGMQPLLSPRQAHHAGCATIGLEITPVYRQPYSETLFPMVLQVLHHNLARALKQTFFEFVRTQTSHRPAHYHALGRRAMVKAVWAVDRQLAEVSNAFQFLLLVTPTNAAAAWSAFKRDHCAHEPHFCYRPLPIDPMLLKRKLYQIHIERVEDPTLLRLFLEKQQELDQQITMLSDRSTPRFLYGSLRLFGAIEESLVQTAEDLLHRLPPRSRDDSHSGYLSAQAFAERAQAEISYYRHACPAFDGTIEIRDDTTSLMVSHGNLLIGTRTRIPVSRTEALLHHEIGTHMLTYFNGRAQPFQQLYAGLAGYEELQEGLAVLAEYLVGGLSRPRLRLLAGRVIAARCLTSGASFIETFRLLANTHHFDQHTAFTITMRIYRGGGLTKDAVYLRGLIRVLAYLHEGGDLVPLFVGKIATDHIPLIRELQLRSVLQPAPLQPRYLNNPDTTTRLERLRRGLSVCDLIERSKV